MALLHNLTEQAQDNTDFRRVVATGEHTQVVVMSIPAEGEIGEEIHEHEDQLLYLIAGNGEVKLGSDTHPFNAGDAVVVPAGENHNVTNTGSEDLKIITTYSPPHHDEGTVHTTKEEADAAEAEESHE